MLKWILSKFKMLLLESTVKKRQAMVWEKMYVICVSGKNGKKVLWFNSKMLIPFFKWAKRCEWVLYKIRYTSGQELIITSIISHQGKAVYSHRRLPLYTHWLAQLKFKRGKKKFKRPVIPSAGKSVGPVELRCSSVENVKWSN